ncbi:MAG: hypothetical protein HKN26_07945 [Acidimicrobiales bacterium]|nr:hypothetical protein [Acidimicrobiales bacterium]
MVLVGSSVVVELIVPSDDVVLDDVVLEGGVVEVDVVDAVEVVAVDVSSELPQPDATSAMAKTAV